MSFNSTVNHARAQRPFWIYVSWKMWTFLFFACDLVTCAFEWRRWAPVLKRVYETITSEKALWVKREAIADRGSADYVFHYLVMSWTLSNNSLRLIRSLTHFCFKSVIVSVCNEGVLDPRYASRGIANSTNHFHCTIKGGGKIIPTRLLLKAPSAHHWGGGVPSGWVVQLYISMFGCSYVFSYV